MNSLKYEHPTIQVLEPDPGHFVIRGTQSAYDTDLGRVVPLEICDIPPGVPSELLAAILDARGFFGEIAEGGDQPSLLADECHALKTALSEVETERDEARAEITRLKNLCGSALPVITEGDRQRFAEQAAQAPVKNKGGRPRKTTEAAQ